MSTPSNPSSLMIYKIIKDYENDGRTMHMIEELEYFAKRSLEIANSISDKDFWSIETIETREDLSRICDLTNSFCELNMDKLDNVGQFYAKTKIGSMPYSWLKGALKTLEEYEEYRSNNPNVSTVVVHHADGSKSVSAVDWSRGPIVVGENSLDKEKSF